MELDSLVRRVVMGRGGLETCVKSLNQEKANKVQRTKMKSHLNDVFLISLFRPRRKRQASFAWIGYFKQTKGTKIQKAWRKPSILKSKGSALASLKKWNCNTQPDFQLETLTQRIAFVGRRWNFSAYNLYNLSSCLLF